MNLLFQQLGSECSKFYQGKGINDQGGSPLSQWSPTFLASGTGFMEDNFSTDCGGVGGRFWDDSSALHLLCTLFLLLLHSNI